MKTEDTEDTVRKILADVRKGGDKAVRKYTLKFDSIRLKQIELSRKQIKDAYKQLGREDIAAIRKAATRIKAFAKKQLAQYRDFEIKEKGLVSGQKVVPLERAGCYVPGGRYPLPSSALMSVIPAKVAGVKEVIVCSPKIKPAVIVAADIAGADRIFNIGGVQAIGAMAYGTRTVPRVDKIVGPGNRYVTAAKKEVYGEVGIDFIAGPSEVMIIADETGDAGLIAADMLAQAEHDPDARADLVTTSRKLADEVKRELKRQLEGLATKETASKALRNGKITVVKSMEKAADTANQQAPEHLEVQVKDERITGRLRNYGSLFIGRYSAEVFGDYCTGTNHILPTGGAARYTGGLSVKDFLKLLTYQKAGKNRELADTASKLAGIEGLEAHRKAAEARR